MTVYLLERVENILAKGKVAHYEPFLLMPQCVQKSSAVYVSNASAVGKQLRKIRKSYQKKLIFIHLQGGKLK